MIEKIIDPFSYSARWDSAGINCGCCKFFQNITNSWPTTNIECTLHNKSLIIELNDDGYLEGEWFCKDFDNREQWPQASKTALEEYIRIQNSLKENILYRAIHKEYLDMVAFDSLEDIIK